MIHIVVETHEDHATDRGRRGYINVAKRGHDGRSQKTWVSSANGGGNTTVIPCRS
ncbi:hypothetical protein A2U01_0068254 [Trifolium medium]|uniref:Uncharacterized protein n=1 Tax=Trifolium medium TaxID=97028 RepID=A0A392SDJ4_9FABA|nr:hypothetical protein [Trifolium medium]